ncbi:transcriptional regulator [Syntrophus gentianae]|uniref:transcriptional regulator n=1 Tax=Syntrophus gentianae TaxID=43775 RepID=UPI000B191A44|nr:transcriptional regulator [Syntrophus gentianae]
MFTFIETTSFEKALPYYLDDDEYAELQQYLINHSETGAVIPGSGGVRKIRWRRQGIGKRGGVRIIYYVKCQYEEIWLLAIHAKAVRENIPAHIVKSWKESIENE